jgi:hypothetical protein
MHCGRSVAHNRVTCTQFGLELSAYSRAEHAEPIAFGVLHDHPVHFALADRDDLGALRLQTPDLGLLVAVYGRARVRYLRFCS